MVNGWLTGEPPICDLAPSPGETDLIHPAAAGLVELGSLGTVES
jgi:hypothetical protein